MFLQIPQADGTFVLQSADGRYLHTNAPGDDKQWGGEVSTEVGPAQSWAIEACGVPTRGDSWFTVVIKVIDEIKPILGPIFLVAAA